MSAFITLTNKQIKEAIFYHMEAMRNHEVESFLLMIIQEAKLWSDLDWAMIRSKLPKEKNKCTTSSKI